MTEQLKALAMAAWVATCVVLCAPPLAEAQCGGHNQRACDLDENLLYPCADGLTYIPGCSGDCPNTPTRRGVCAQLPFAPMSEPLTGRAEKEARPDPMWGYADLHAHMMAHLAHGGAALVGKPYDEEGGVNFALQQDYGSAILDRDYPGAELLTYLEAPLASGINCPAWIPNCGNRLLHGDHFLVDDALGVGTQDAPGSNLGAPLFNGWPTWRSTTHQQMYYKWLKRAWQGGLRLMVMMAVSNEAACDTGKHLDGTPCSDSMAFVDRQLAAAYDMERFIESRNPRYLPAVRSCYLCADGEESAPDSERCAQYPELTCTDDSDCQGGSGSRCITTTAPVPVPPEGQCRVCLPEGCKVVPLQCTTDSDCDEAGGGTCVNKVQETDGWFRIVKTPEEAREVISQGKLAVVLGIEVDNLFGCKLNSSCTEASVKAAVDHYYNDWGVRHIFPIHNFDNAFGGPATWETTIAMGNYISEGAWFEAEECSDEYDFRLNGSLAHARYFAASGGQIAPEVNYDYLTATCNSRGLTGLGERLIGELMDKGMMIDIDHMSRKSIDDTISLSFERRPSYPLVASHVLVHERHLEGNRHERMRTRAQLQQVAKSGGMIGLMLKDDVQDTDKRGTKVTSAAPGSPVRDDCRHSTKSFAQALDTAVETMRGVNGDLVGPVGLGSDFNGVAGHLGPRFGSDACGGRDAPFDDPQYQRLQYPFRLPGFGRFHEQRTGLKTFDFNVDGLAHVGLLPDLVKDLADIGVPSAQLEQLFHSAEQYVRSWERARESGQYRPPAAECEDRSLSADASCLADTSVATTALENDPSVSLAQSPPGPYGLGATQVTLTVNDNPKNSCTAQVTVEDRSPPTISCPVDAIFECENWGATVNPLPEATVTDNCTAPSASCGRLPEDPDQGSDRYYLGGTGILCEVSDGSGVQCPYPLLVQDTQPPVFESLPDDVHSVECASPQGTAVELDTAFASDACVGEAEVISDAPVIYPPRQTTTVTFVARDGNGNTTEASRYVSVQDTTPPEITCPADTVAECTGGGAANVDTGAATATDLCGGVELVAEAPEVLGLGTSPVVHTATDEGGLSSSCTQTVTVEDTTPPEITCPADATIECAADHSAPFTPALAEVFDLCAQNGGPALTVVSPAPGTFPLGTSDLDYSVTDVSDLRATCSSQVTVADTTPPAITCPANVVAECTGGGGADVEVDAAAASDICGGVSVHDDSPGRFSLGELDVTHTATDDGGLTNTCAQAVWVVDTTPPEITCPPPATVECTGDHRAFFTPAEPEVFDVCAQNGGPALTVVTPASGAFSLGTSDLDYSVTDVSDLRAECTSSVAVVDTTPPVIESITPSQETLLLPDHKLVDIAVAVVAADACDPTPPVCTLTSIESDEPDNGIADGNTTGDTEIVGPLAARLRAERSGVGDGRVYTLHLSCADQAGNTTPGSTAVFVPHDHES